PSDQPYHEVEFLRVSRGRQPALISDGIYDSTSDTSGTTVAPTWARVAQIGSTVTTTEEPTTTTTTLDTQQIHEEFMNDVNELCRELDWWDTSSSVFSPLSSDLSSIDLSTPTSATTARSLDAWDCETQLGEEDAPPVSKSLLRGVYDLLATIFCNRRIDKEEI
ncbi:hypothetical protein PFISCL1PPCAC_696, partial [Pristionchus fissidentatus]